MPLTEDDFPRNPSESLTPASVSYSMAPLPETSKTLERNSLLDAKTPADNVTDDAGMGLGLSLIGSPAKCSFSVGDFVWGKKAKNHPWWPGLVCDPTSRAKGPFKGGHSAVTVAWFGGGGSCSWCEPSLIKHFVPEFHVMEKQSGTKSFVTAVEDALDEFRRCLELELSCHCVPPEARAKNFEGRVQLLPIENFECSEFLRRLHDVACNGAKASMLEIAMLRSWVMAFGKGWTSGSPGHHIRRGMSELVDKIDRDVSPGYVGHCNGNVEEEKEVVRKKSKRKSIIKFLLEMDLDTADLSKDEEVKVGKKGSEKRKDKAGDGQEWEGKGGSVSAKEYSASGRRERKRSKYLSPPYADCAEGIKSLVSLKSVDNNLTKENSKCAQITNAESPAILKRNSKSVQKKGDKMSPFTKLGSVCANNLLSELLYAAINPVHLKGNQSAKTVRAFFGLYRSSVHASGSGFFEYQNLSSESSGKKLKSVNEVMKRCFEVGVAEQKAGYNDNGPGTKFLGGSKSDSRSPAEPSNPGRKQKMKREASIGGVATVKHQIVHIPVESIFEQSANTGPVTCQQPESKHEVTKSKMVGGSKSDSRGPAEPSKSGRKRKMTSIGGVAPVKRQIVDIPVESIFEQSANTGPVTCQQPESKHEMTKSKMVGGSKSVSRSPAEPSKSGRKRKMKKEVSSGGVAPVKRQIVDIPVESIFEQNSNTGPVNCQRPESKHEMTKSKMVNNCQNVALLGHCIAKKFQEGKSAKKKKKTDNVPTNASPSLNSKITGGLKKKSMDKQEDGCDYRYRAALLLAFSAGITLPSKDELISTFSKYGAIIEPETEMMKQKGSARVVFAKSTDAEKAFNSTDKTGIFKSDTSYRLGYLTPIASSSSPTRSFPKPSLPYIRENLERMISTLTSSSSTLKDSGSSGALKSDARENLVGDMEGLLKKVNMMLSLAKKG